MRDVCCAVYSDLGFSPLLGVGVCVWDWEFFSPAVGTADEHSHYLARKAAAMCFIPMLYIYQCDLVH